MECVVHDAEDVGGGGFADEVFFVVKNCVVEAALLGVVECEEVVGVRGRFHSCEERVAWMVERCFAERDACGWIFGAGNRDPDEVVGADARACERAGSGADCEADPGAALIEFCGGELMDDCGSQVVRQWISPAKAIARGEQAGDVLFEQCG